MPNNGYTQAVLDALAVPCGDCCRARADYAVEYQFALAGVRANQVLEQRDGLLRGVGCFSGVWIVQGEIKQIDRKHPIPSATIGMVCSRLSENGSILVRK